MDISKELQELGFVRAGAIRPDNTGTMCWADIDPDVPGCLVYAQVVDGKPMKFGSTTTTLRDRMRQNASTIRKIIELQDGRCTRDARWHHEPWDAFKKLAPSVIRAGKQIEVWVIRQPTIAGCQLMEQRLNVRYGTIENGWAESLA